MFYEERIGSFRELGSELRALDQDAGVRLIGGRGVKSTLAFVTRFGKTYTLVTYNTKRGGAPGRRLQTLEFQDPDDLEVTLKKLAGKRLRAWVY